MTVSSGETRVLQPSAWRRAAVPLLFAVTLLAVVLHTPLGVLFPEATRPWVPVLVIVVVAASSIGGGLALAYPRVLVDADGALRVRGRVIAPQEITVASRSVSRGRTSGITYRLATASGFRVRILVAHTTLRTLTPAQLAVLRDVIAASRVPVATMSDVERIAADMVASGRYLDVDQRTLVAELDSVLPATPSADATDSSGATPDTLVHPPGRATAEQVQALLDQLEADDAAAADDVAKGPAGLRIARRAAGWLCVAAAVAVAVMLVVLVVMESGGRDFGAADEEPLVMAMLLMLLALLCAYLVWALFADLHDAQLRHAGQAWLAAASPEQRRRGLPVVYTRAFMGAVGGRLGFAGFMALAVVALLAIIAAPITMAETEISPLASGAILVAGLVLATAAIVWWRHRQRQSAERIRWLVEASGQRATGPDTGHLPPSGSVDAGR